MKLKSLIIILVLMLSLLILASCSDKGYTIKFDSNGATAVESQNVTEGGKLTDPGTPVKEGEYEFEGWYRGDKLWNFETDTVSYAFTLTAKWSKIHTVSFDSDGGTAIGIRKAKDGGFVIQPATPVKPGFTFIGWFAGDTKWNFDENVVSSDMTLKAGWARTLSVIFNSNGGSPVADASVGEGQTMKEPTPPTKENAEFIGWFVGDTKWDFENDVFTSNLTLTARWNNTTTYTVSFNTDGGTEIPPQYIVHGNKATEPDKDPTKEGFRFVGWTCDGAAWDFAKNTVTSDKVIVASWSPINTSGDQWTVLPVDRWSYTVTFDSDGGTEFPAKNYASNKTLYENDLHLPRPEKKGYTFAGWYLDGVRFDESCKVTKDITLVAKWGYTVTFINGDTQFSAVVLPGETVSQPNITAENGKTLDGWYTDGGLKWNFESNKVTADTKLTAKWK